MSEAVEQWYRWRWDRLFHAHRAAQKPDLPQSFCVLSMVDDLKSLPDCHGYKSLGWPEDAAYPDEVLRLYAGESRSLNTPDRAALAASNRTLFRLHRAYQQFKTQRETVAPFWGDLPSADYLSQLRQNFMTQCQPDHEVSGVRQFYDNASRTANRLLLTRGSKKMSAFSALQRLFDVLEELDAVLGLFTRRSETILSDIRRCALSRNHLSFEDIQTQINSRTAARIGRNWKEADDIKAMLQAKNIVVSDVDGHTEWWVNPESHS